MSASDAQSNLARLLTEPIFSDLVLRCEGQNFKVHRCIVCLRSPVLAAACTGQFKEATERVIDVTVADVSALKRLITYLYAGDYDDGTASFTGESAVFVSQADEKMSISEPETDERTVEPTEKIHYDTDSANRSLASSNSNQALMANANVYIVAEYYQIPELRDLAVSKFCKASEDFCPQGFSDVVALVYGSEALSTAQELRFAVCSTVARNAKTLINDATFIDECVELPDLMREVLPKLVAEYESRSEMERARVIELTSELTSLRMRLKSMKTQSAAAEVRLREAEQKPVNMRQKVNEAKCCRHCGKENNVFFEYDYGAYSLRCVCRTRY